MGLIQAFIRNPVKVAVGVLLVVLFGFIALVRMPMQLTPEVQVPTLTVETKWPGASPQEVEREIVQEQEEQLKGVEGVTKMTSESIDSSGKIILEFMVGANMQEALLKVNSRLQQVPEYPIDADEPVISTSNSTDQPIAWFILGERKPDLEKIRKYIDAHSQFAAALEPVLQAHTPDLAAYRLRKAAEKHPELKELLPVPVEVEKMRRFAEDRVEARLERVKGVSQANVIGGREEEFQVIVDPEQLAARRLTIADVRNALALTNKDTSGGDFWEGKRRLVVRTLGQFRSPEDVQNVIIARRDGRPVYVRDVAEAVLGYKKPDGIVKRFGSRSIAVNALRETGANVLDVMAGLQKATQELNDGILKENNLSLVQVYDETEYIYSAVGLVESNIVVGGLLTIAVLLLFLRSGRSTLVLGLAIPTSIIGTFLVMHLLGRSLNVISLAGLAFAVGMLVDNAVVVLENIYSHYQRGEDPFTAAARGTYEVWGAVVASTLTTLAVFLPVLFVQEEAGQLFRDIALAISGGVFLSLVVAVTVIPVAASRVLAKQETIEDEAYEKGHPHNIISANDDLPSGDGHVQQEAIAVLPAEEHHHDTLPGERSRLAKLLLPFDWFGKSFVALVMSINNFLQRSVLLRLAATCIIVAAAVIGSYVLLPQVDYLPNGNRNLIIGLMIPPSGYNLDELESLGKRVEASLLPYWDVDPESEETKNLPFPVIEDFFFVVRGPQVFLGMRAREQTRAGELLPLAMQSVNGFPGTMGIAFQSSLFQQGLAGGTKVDIEITGPELETLVGLGGRMMGMLGEAAPTAQKRPVPSLDLSSPEVHVSPKWEQAKDMQMDATELGYSVDALVDGAYATDYYLGGKKIDLSIVGAEEFARRSQNIRALPVAMPTGELVPLDAVAHINEFGTGPEQINHRERQRAITIEATPPLGMPLEELQRVVQTKIVDPLRAEGALGSEYEITLGGTADKLRDTWQALRFNLVLALLITYLLMAALFESWIYPFVIILTVPLGAVGGLLGLSLLNGIGQFYGVYQALDVITMLGFVILIGTVVNNPILIVDQSLLHMRQEGMTPRQAVLAAVRNRIRPIFMTTITTVMGLMPLVLFPGSGSELYRGLGAVLLGGLMLSTVVTLVLVPTVFTLFLDTQAALRRLLGGLFRRRDRSTAEAETPETPSEEVLAPPLLPAEIDTDGLTVEKHVTLIGGNGNGAAGKTATGNGAPTEPRERSSAR